MAFAISRGQAWCDATCKKSTPHDDGESIAAVSSLPVPVSSHYLPQFIDDARGGERHFAEG